MSMRITPVVSHSLSGWLYGYSRMQSITWRNFLGADLTLYHKSPHWSSEKPLWTCRCVPFEIRHRVLTVSGGPDYRIPEYVQYSVSMDYGVWGYRFGPHWPTDWSQGLIREGLFDWWVAWRSNKSYVIWVSLVICGGRHHLFIAEFSFVGHFCYVCTGCQNLNTVKSIVDRYILRLNLIYVNGPPREVKACWDKSLE